MAIDTDRPAIFGLNNYAKGATITASEEKSGHDADKLKVASYSGTYRSTTTTADRNVDLDLGEVKSDVGALALFGANLSDSAVWQILADSDSGFPSPEHDSTEVSVFDVSKAPYVDDAPNWGRPAIYLPSSDWAGQYIRFQLTDTGNPDGYLEAAYAVVSPLIQPAVFMQGGWSPGVEWVGSVGHSIAITTHKLTLRACDEETRRKVLSIARALHATGRFGFVPRPGDASLWLHEAGIFRLTAIEQVFLEGYGLWDITLTFREVFD